MPAGGARGAQLADDFQHIGEADAARNGPLAGALDDRAIGQRIAEGHAQLDRRPRRCRWRPGQSRGVVARSGSPAVR